MHTQVTHVHTHKHTHNSENIHTYLYIPTHAPTDKNKCAKEMSIHSNIYSTSEGILHCLKFQFFKFRWKFIFIFYKTFSRLQKKLKESTP